MVDHHLFMPINVEIVENIPLYSSWPNDRLTWHHTCTGHLMVRSAYHLLQHHKWSKDLLAMETR